MVSKQTVQEWAPVILVWACLLLLPVGRMVELPVAIMALLGLIQCFRQGWRGCVHGPHGFFSLVMLLFWLPQVFSLPNAVDFSRAFGGAVSFFRFYFSGIYIISSFNSVLSIKRLLKLCSIVLLFWMTDALFQAVVGVDFFGFPIYQHRINGVFAEKLKLGPYFVIFLPILICYLRENFNVFIEISLMLAMTAVVLLSGSRSSWVMYFFILLFYALHIFKKRFFRLPNLFGISVGAVGLVLVCSFLYPPFQAKIKQTSLLFHGDRQSIDTALSARLEIWDAALKMIKDHPVTGVGVRGFRYAYPDYAGPNDRYLKLSGGKTGPTHSHMIALEILTETGVIGFIGYLGAVSLLILRWFRLNLGEKNRLLPFGLATLASLLPFNTHMAFYSAALAQVIFLFVALYCCNIVDLNPNESTIDEATV